MIDVKKYTNHRFSKDGTFCSAGFLCVNEQLNDISDTLLRSKIQPK